jgi:hypothetical protein
MMLASNASSTSCRFKPVTTNAAAAACDRQRIAPGVGGCASHDVES